MPILDVVSNVLMSNTRPDGFVRARSTRAAPWVSMAMLALLAACGASGVDRAAAVEASAPPSPSQTPSSSADSTAPPTQTDAAQADTPLPGAGAVAFDAAGTRIAWSSGSDVRIRELSSGTVAPLAAGAAVADLGFAPDDALWTVGGDVARWHDGQRTCTAQVDADRLLAVDAQGVVVAGYTQGDGTGMLRQQVWLDNDCRIARERSDPLPATVADAESDPGAPLQRESLRAPRLKASAAPTLPEGAQAIASSSDGRYWVIDVAGQRQLHDAGAN